eukprot:EG_transcript_8729
MTGPPNMLRLRQLWHPQNVTVLHPSQRVPGTLTASREGPTPLWIGLSLFLCQLRAVVLVVLPPLPALPATNVHVFQGTSLRCKWSGSQSQPPLREGQEEGRPRGGVGHLQAAEDEEGGG